MLLRFCAVILVSLLVGCGAHSPISVGRTEGTPVPGQTTTYAAHSNPVLITQLPLPENAKYQVIETIDISSGWYGDAEGKLNKPMANRARKVGADAVILVQRWYQPKAFAWAAPNAKGQAVKLLNPESFDLKTVSGSWE